MWELLLEVEAALQTITEVKTVNIGLEKGISAKDAPAARVYQVYSDTKDGIERGTLQILILLDLKNDVREVSKQTAILEEKIRKAVKLTHLGTEYDRDTVTSFKATIMSFSYKLIRGTGCELA